MKSYFIFTIVLTVAYLVYYAVVIVQDLYGKKGNSKPEEEVFDLGAPEDEQSVSVKESLGSGLFIVSSRVGSRLGLCNRHNGWTRYRRVCHTSRLWFPLSFVRQGHCQGNSEYTCIFANTSMSFSDY